MGGSLMHDNVEAVPYNLKANGMKDLVWILWYLTLNGATPEKYFGANLAGSSRLAVSCFDAMVELNYSLGDIDVFVDKNVYDKVCANLATAPKDTVLYFRKGKMRSTGLFRISDTSQPTQVDLIPCEFENGAPKKYFVFSHFSSMVDTRNGVKGFAHKLLCRAFTAGTDWHFSVDYGCRKDNSNEYISDFDTVCREVLGVMPGQAWSFDSLLRALKERPRVTRVEIIDKFGQLIFGEHRQKSSRFPEKDLANMTAIYNQLDKYGLLTYEIEGMFEERKRDYAR